MSRGKRMDSGKPRSMPDHGEPAGDEYIELAVRCHKSGALSVHGYIENKEWAIAVLENAKDAIRGYHAKKEALIIVPAKDVTIAPM